MSHAGTDDCRAVSWILGANSVLGTDISEKMIAAAVGKNRPNADVHFDQLEYKTVDARDPDFTLDVPADLVTAMYLFHYASSVDDLNAMCRFVGRNLRAGGRFVCYTPSTPDYDFERQYPLMGDVFGFHYKIVEPPKYHHLGDRRFRSTDVAVEPRATRTGAQGCRSGEHPVASAGAAPMIERTWAPTLQWYLDNPSLIVLSAEKSVE